MNRSDEFLKTFSAIERWLRRRAGVGREVPFHQVVERAAEREALVRRYRNDLKEFADLRNAIVHERSDEHVLAEPNARAVTDIQRLEAKLTSPPTVEAFLRRVEAVETDEPLARAVTRMRERGYSQLPATRGGRFVALLTANTIVRWLGARAGEDLVSLADTPVSEVLRQAQATESHAFLARAATLDEALALFAASEAAGRPHDALLITHGGKASEAILGILTVADVPRMLALLDPRRRAGR